MCEIGWDTHRTKDKHTERQAKGQTERQTERQGLAGLRGAGPPRQTPGPGPDKTIYDVHWFLESVVISIHVNELCV